MNRVKQITFIALYVAIIVAFQTLLSSINGIELTTLLFTSAAIFLPLHASLTLVIVYCLIEGVMFGFGDWVILYLIYWSFVVIITFLLKLLCKKYLIFTALLNAIFGFLLGIFFFLEMLILYGESSAISYYITGLQGDLLHLVSNFLITLILFPPIQKLFPKIIHVKTKKV